MPLTKYISGDMWRMRWAGLVASLRIAPGFLLELCS